MSVERGPKDQKTIFHYVVNTATEHVLGRAARISDILAHLAETPPMSRREALFKIVAFSAAAVAAGCQPPSNTAKPIQWPILPDSGAKPAPTTATKPASTRENQAPPTKEPPRPLSGEIPLGAIPPISGLTEPQKTNLVKTFTNRFPVSPPGPDKIGEAIRDLTKYILEKLPREEANKVLKDINRLHNLSLFKAWGQVSGKASSDALKMVYTKLRKIGEAIARGEQIFRGPLPSIFYLSVPCGNISEVFLFVTKADIQAILTKAGCSQEFDPYNPQSYIDNIIRKITNELPQSSGAVLQAEIAGDLTSRLNDKINQLAIGALF